jgi:nicotinamide-nucleotide amidase
VPFEFKQMVTEQFLPFVRESFQLGTATRLHKFLTLGHGESLLADRIGALPLPPGITLGYRPSIPHVEIKVFARGAGALAAMDSYLGQLRGVLADAIVSERFASIAEETHTLLRDGAHTLALAESCTGGMLASQLVEYPGSSDYLQHGLITYSNEAKRKLLGVPAETLDSHGAVSTATALAMARGARAISDSDFALAITGIAGPDGGSADKPVGTVVIALADRANCWVQTVTLGQRSRTMVRAMSCAVALDMLRRRVLKQNPLVPYPFIPARDSHMEQCH